LRDKDPEWITIEKVEDIYKYLTDEVLAQEFKAFLHCKAQEEKKGYPVFVTKDAQPKGFTSTVTYDGKDYHSLGVMMSKKQAEQSAAEVCLRSLGDFPDVPKDKYTIQVYRGGQVHLQARRQERTAKAYHYSLLQGFIASLGHQFPQYCYKETSSGHEAVCYFEGKMFQSGTAENLIDAKNRAAFEALTFFGFDDKKSKEATELRDMLRIKHKKSFIPIGVLMSPLIYSPSKRPGWMFYHFQSTDQISAESSASIKECESLFNIKKWTALSAEQIMSNVFGKSPSIEGKPLHERQDISVGEINGENKNIAIIGNDQCSFRMFCQDGKIRCDNRKCDVELLPGHNIRGLKCSYKLLYPSLQVYLHAESCDDLFYPNPPKPVLTSCGTVVLMFDHESSAQDIQILLTRPSNQITFASKARSLASYLNKLISGTQSQSRFDVAECTANIDTWTRNEVRLLSEMTMESLHELMSPYVRYDDRWNEIFAKEHPDVLKELEDSASAELTRRTEEGIEDEINRDPWVLPNSRFAHRLLQTGVLVENQLMCTFRSLLEMTGLKVKLGELEKSPYIDIPCEDNTNPHRGDASRYYIWTGLRTVSAGEDEMYYKGSEMKKQLGDEWLVDGDGDRRTARNAKRRQGKEKKPYNNKRLKFPEGGVETVKIEEEKPANEEDASEKTPVADDEKPEGEEVKAEEGENQGPDETQPAPQAEEKRREHREPRGAKNTKAIQEEVRWFPLEEAKELCPMLMTISSTTQFLGQVESLQTRADTFMKEKASSAV